MSQVRLLYVENLISRKFRTPRQELTFFVVVENISFEKEVDIFLAGEDGRWQTLSARFHSSPDQQKEYWLARGIFKLTDQMPLPGNIRFGVCYRTEGSEFWDNNQGMNYDSQADSGISLFNDIALMNVQFKDRLGTRQKSLPVTVAVAEHLQAYKVQIYWTTDNWQHTHITSCRTKLSYWQQNCESNARNPNHSGARIWKARLRIGEAFRVQYSICCETPDGKIWDNNYGQNYQTAHQSLKILILNLHCYQESQQDLKFTTIARAISKLKADIICFQEVAELWNDGQGNWQSNSARIINDRLPKPFHLYTDWSHLGFDQYREGVAILSRFPLSNKESRYVSDSQDIYSIHSRKVVMTRLKVPFIGMINVFSAHLSWWEDGFKEQFERLCEWARNLTSDGTEATLLCGDFNITAGSEGYSQVVDTHEFEDQYLAANEQGLFEKIFRVNDAHWRHLLAEDYRIDYIFLNKGSGLKVMSASVIFTDQDFGRVSDHSGYLMTFEPK